MKVHALFSTPLAYVHEALPRDVAAVIAAATSKVPPTENTRTPKLEHRDIHALSAQFPDLAPLLLKYVAQFGRALLGESLEWRIQLLWANRMTAGGFQKRHNHINSVVSGVLYLTDTENSTVFYRDLPVGLIQFGNSNTRAENNAFRATSWRAGAAGAGDLILFPSGLYHEVLEHTGSPRVTVAFNCLPKQMATEEYVVTFL